MDRSSRPDGLKPDDLIDLNVPRLLLGVIVRAVRDAQGDLAEVTSPTRRAIMEDARRFLYSDEGETFALAVGFSVKTFRQYRNNIPRPREQDGT